MIIADTSVWIEFFKGSQRIFPYFEERLINREIIGIECVFGELLQGCSNEREIKIVKNYWDSLPKVGETDVWIEAGEFLGRNNLISKGVGLIDSVILILAVRSKCKIWTSDKKLLNAIDQEFIFEM